MKGNFETELFQRIRRLLEKQVGGHCICKIFLWNGEAEGKRKILFWGKCGNCHKI